MSLPWVEYWESLDHVAIDSVTNSNILNRKLPIIWKDDKISYISKPEGQFLHSQRVYLVF